MLKRVLGNGVIALLFVAPLAAQEPSCGNGKWTLLRQDERTARLGDEVATRIATAPWRDWERGVLLGDGLVLTLHKNDRHIDLGSRHNGIVDDPVTLQRAEPRGPFDCRYVFEAPKIRLIVVSR